jgi:hypothetical protein
MLSNIKTIDELFSLWKQDRPNYNPFSNDGILVQEAWDKASPQIAFILKESNDDFVDIRGRAWGPGGNSPCFWRNLNIWKYVVTSLFRKESPSLEQAMVVKEEPLGDVAYVNLKKKAECKSTSYDPDISKYIEDDWSFLSRQIEIISPKFLFFCGSFRFVQAKMEFTSIGQGVFRVGDQIAVDFFHPSCRKGYNETFSLLKNRLGCLKLSS